MVALPLSAHKKAAEKGRPPGVPTTASLALSIKDAMVAIIVRFPKRLDLICPVRSPKNYTWFGKWCHQLFTQLQDYFRR
jgi:hypothetical protein